LSAVTGRRYSGSIPNTIWCFTPSLLGDLELNGRDGGERALGGGAPGLVGGGGFVAGDNDGVGDDDDNDDDDGRRWGDERATQAQRWDGGRDFSQNAVFTAR